MKFNFTITYPTTLDTLSNPTSGNGLNSPDHATQHADANDAIEALEAKVGVNSSAVTTSHDYKLSGVTGSDKAVSKTGTETLTNKTLTSPVINLGTNATGDIYYRDSGGAFQRLAIGSASQILQVSSGGIPEWIANPGASDASTTTKGVVEEATLAETLARTTAGATSARLFVNPSTLTTVQTYDYAADSVGTDAYAITVTPAPTAYVTGQVFKFKAGTANTGGATLNVNSLGAKTLVKDVSSALVTGDILANQIVEVVYDGTNMQIISLLGGVTAPIFTNGQTTRDLSTASGNQTIAHGLGRTPKNIKITAIQASTSGATDNYSFGAYNGTTNSSIYRGQNGNGQYYVGGDNTNVINIMTTASNDTSPSTATATFDSTNITLAWTKATSATGTAYILWEAE